MTFFGKYTADDLRRLLENTKRDHDYKCRSSFTIVGHSNNVSHITFELNHDHILVFTNDNAQLSYTQKYGSSENRDYLATFYQKEVDDPAQVFKAVLDYIRDFEYLKAALRSKFQ